jgi:hypothetical protein
MPEALELAEKNLWIARRTDENGGTAFLTPKKAALPNSELFPYPNFLAILPKKPEPLTEPTRRTFLNSNIARAVKIIRAVTAESKAGAWVPTHEHRRDNLLSMELYIDTGLCVLLMPLRTCLNSDNLRRDPIDPAVALPGLFE